ncbi:MAG: acyl-CoA dehydrogenase family protein [Hydrogenophilaceae bacterium]|jgi:alkylation response protein AidB-like acyl-CoA dehydrogenase|nr:acyl-CoA dehydrogenase family protein [Hydrogenophilaceae bacterium]
MNLDLGPEYAAFRAHVADFLARHWPPAPGADPAQAAAAFRREAVEAGFLYRSVPRIYGGGEQAPDPARARIIREEFARAGAPRELEGPGVSMLVPTLLARGADWQKERFIPKTLSGEIIWCQGYSEPGAGSDLASLRTKAVLEGDEWVITGQKVWTTLAHLAHYMFILVRTEPDAPKHEGLSYLLLDMKQPGVTVRPLKQMTGGREFNEVFLDGARTPAHWIVGKRGEGWAVSRTTLKHERDAIGSSARTEDMFAKLVQLARSVEIDGAPAIERADIRQALARIEGYVLAQRYSSFRAQSMSNAGEEPGLIGALNKLNGAEIGHRIAALAQELIGDDGLSMPPLGRKGGARGHEKWVNQIMGSLGVAIAGGSSNIQRNVIAERALGLPRGHGDGA